MQDTAGEVGTSSLVIHSYEPLHMAEQKQDDQLEPTYNSSVRIRRVALTTCRKQWTMGSGGERGSEISVLMAQQDDDDDNERYTCCVRTQRLKNYILELKRLLCISLSLSLYIYIYICKCVRGVYVYVCVVVIRNIITTCQINWLSNINELISWK